MTTLSVRFEHEDAVRSPEAEKPPRVFSGEALAGILTVTGSGAVQTSFDMVEIVFEGSFLLRAKWSIVLMLLAGIVKSEIRGSFVVKGRQLDTLPVGEAVRACRQRCR